ncbi:hypothetical protein [Bacillus sp. 123MFChir2]|uniref:hypothetical protein n=1 Tax=Bacillus sp. 123MFChir2 TaxID=1169144 RepID=UPI000370D245|nr:hypothetical protein [Bacillus sp. 123MFChir2]
MSDNLERVVFSRNEYDIELKMDIEFKFENTYVFSKEKKLIMESIRVIPSIDGPHEINRYIRPQILIIQGILSYFSGIPFTIYEHRAGEVNVVNTENEVNKELKKQKLIIEGVDYSDDLHVLLDKLSEPKSKSLVITLLDRWRKARYMEMESEVDIYHDEVILTYFHILELLVEGYYENLKKEADKQIKNFVGEFTSKILNQRGNSLNNTVNSKFKLLKSLLVSEEMSIASKINYFLKSYNMLDDQTYFLVNKLVKIRNAVAHGRITYKDKVIWMLPPFFNLTNNSDSIISIISVFTARAIGLHLGLKAWENDWEHVYIHLSPPDEVLSSFMKDENQHINVSALDLIQGTNKKIKVSYIVDFYIENNKKYQYSVLEVILSKVLKEISIDEENCFELFLASVLMGDSEDEELSNISRANVEAVHQNDWYGYSNIKDIYRYFEYHGIHVQWFEEWLQSDGHIRK